MLQNKPVALAFTPKALALFMNFPKIDDYMSYLNSHKNTIYVAWNDMADYGNDLSLDCSQAVQKLRQYYFNINFVKGYNNISFFEKVNSIYSPDNAVAVVDSFGQLMGVNKAYSLDDIISPYELKRRIEQAM